MWYAGKTETFCGLKPKLRFCLIDTYVQKGKQQILIMSCVYLFKLKQKRQRYVNVMNINGATSVVKKQV